LGGDVKLLIVGLWISQLAMGATLEGTWEGKAYRFSLDGQRVEGSWGNRTYDLQVDSVRKRVFGKMDEGRVDFEYDERWKELAGELPCGKIQLFLYGRVMEVAGKICGEKVSEIVDKKPDLLPRLYELALTPVTREFPLTVADSVREFLKKLLSRFES